jgi:CubicO group peptidase (beta-lactamase class C family)
VGSAGLLPILGAGEVDARSHDILGARPGLLECRQDDLEATSRLAVYLLRRVGSVRHDRSGSGDEHVLAHSHRAREADNRLVGGTGGDEAALHERTSIAVLRALEQIDAWPAPHAAVGVVNTQGTLASRGPVDSRFPWASVTKLASTYGVLVAAEEGVVDLDDAAGPPGSTVRHLLSHASGLPLDGESPIAAPGERRIYSNTGFEHLARLVHAGAEMPFPAYVTAAVLAPLDMFVTELTGSAAFGMSGSLDNLLKFAQELLSPSVIAPETFAEATEVAFPGLVGVLPGFGRQDPNDWGLGFELRDGKSPHWTGARNSPRSFGHFGRAGTFLWVDPDAGLACGCLTDLEFGDWAREAWPRLSDAILVEHSS